MYCCTAVLHSVPGLWWLKVIRGCHYAASLHSNSLLGVWRQIEKWRLLFQWDCILKQVSNVSISLADATDSCCCSNVSIKLSACLHGCIAYMCCVPISIYFGQSLGSTRLPIGRAHVRAASCIVLTHGSDQLSVCVFGICHAGSYRLHELLTKLLTDRWDGMQVARLNRRGFAAAHLSLLIGR